MARRRDLRKGLAGFGSSPRRSEQMIRIQIVAISNVVLFQLARKMKIPGVSLHTAIELCIGKKFDEMGPVPRLYIISCGHPISRTAIIDFNELKSRAPCKCRQISWNVTGSRSMYKVLNPLGPSLCRSCSSKNLEKYEGALEFSAKNRGKGRPQRSTDHLTL